MKTPYIPGILCKILGHGWREAKPSIWVLRGQRYRVCDRCRACQVFDAGIAEWRPKTPADEGPK